MQPGQDRRGTPHGVPRDAHPITVQVLNSIVAALCVKIDNRACCKAAKAHAIQKVGLSRHRNLPVRRAVTLSGTALYQRPWTNCSTLSSSVQLGVHSSAPDVSHIHTFAQTQKCWVSFTALSHICQFSGIHIG